MDMEVYMHIYNVIYADIIPGYYCFYINGITKCYMQGYVQNNMICLYLSKVVL